VPPSVFNLPAKILVFVINLLTEYSLINVQIVYYVV
jgi:hypothetical protein